MNTMFVEKYSVYEGWVPHTIHNKHKNAYPRYNYRIATVKAFQLLTEETEYTLCYLC